MSIQFYLILTTGGIQLRILLEFSYERKIVIVTVFWAYNDFSYCDHSGFSIMSINTAKS